MSHKDNHSLESLQAALQGELYWDQKMLTLYATDASLYKQMPLAVALPKNVEDLQLLVRYARDHKTSLIARTAGTSLAGQCVGTGIVVDTSRHLNKIIEINEQEKWVRVQPGVIRDDLNKTLAPYGLQFGPNTSTSNRCMIGGMTGNNSCGSTSIVYGATRDHVLELKTVLADGECAHFRPLSKAEYMEQSGQGDTVEANAYRFIHTLLSDAATRQLITANSPHPDIRRRNTGYALDELMDCELFSGDAKPFNFCKLLAGSEGTLALTYEIKLNLIPLPPKHKALVCAHFHTIAESYKSAVVGMQHQPYAVELMDHHILECTKTQREQLKNRFFVEGDPAAIMVFELCSDTVPGLEGQIRRLVDDLKGQGLGYHYPIVEGKDIQKVWNLRAAGLGLLSNLPGDGKPLGFIEDTAVRVQDLPAYIQDIDEMLARYGKSSVHFAHAGAGELHLRPIMNLRDAEDYKLFRIIGQETAEIVKKYRGALSGEHGDGRVRGEFVKYMVGDEVYALFKMVKNTFDPQNIFNPGKITDVPPMDTNLRYEVDVLPPHIETMLDFSATKGLMRMAEQCNGSGDCRKTHISGGTMCPSYMATLNEQDTTRARANVMREFMMNSTKQNRFDHKEIYEVMELCLSCKGCTSECPSNVDMAALKAEFLYQYQKANGVPLRSRLFGNIGKINSYAAAVSGINNFFLGNRVTASIIKKTLGVAAQRSLPLLYKHTLVQWINKEKKNNNKSAKSVHKKIWLFADEFTNYNDVTVGQAAYQLLNKLGYDVELAPIYESGRAAISKGLLDKAQQAAIHNFEILKDIISAAQPMIGIEPSAILTFRDEFSKLLPTELQPKAVEIGKHCMLLEEFLQQEMEAGIISSEQFTNQSKKVLLHGHCHQKSLASVDCSAHVLALPANYQVEVIPSGCCGMAGSFGYEKEHYEVSMQVGELVLFPNVRKAAQETIIAAPGTSCRHQIMDGTKRKSLHPAEVLWEAVIK